MAHYFHQLETYASHMGSGIMDYDTVAPTQKYRFCSMYEAAWVRESKLFVCVGSVVKPWASIKLSVRGACMHARRFCQTQLTHTDPGKTGNQPAGAKIHGIRDTGTLSPAGTARYGTSINLPKVKCGSTTNYDDWIINNGNMPI